MEFSELEDVRVKLEEKSRDEFWKIVDEFGGVKDFSNAFEISSSKMYNWKSKDSFIPINLVKMAFGNNSDAHVKAFKGPGRSKPIKDAEFPLEINDELLTRVSCSVTVNKNGIPLYQASDIGLLKRFTDLLDNLGDVPYTIYERQVYEVRYPKYLHEIFQEIDYTSHLDALVDEKATINEQITVNNREIPASDIGNLYHREKRLKVALMKEDKDEVAKMMSEEKEKIRKALKQA